MILPVQGATPVDTGRPGDVSKMDVNFGCPKDVLGTSFK